MKKLFLAGSLISLITGLYAEQTYHDYNYDQKEAYQTETKRGISRPANATILSARDFETGLTQTKAIDTPGQYYILTQDVGFKGDLDEAIAINITADNITLDLGGHTLYYDIDNIDENDLVNGILISGANNVTIKNGTIATFTGEAIVVKVNCRGITLENIKVIGGGGQSCSGIHFEGTAATNDASKVLNSTIRNCTVENADGGGENEAYACKLAFSENILIEDCNFLRSEAATGETAYGVWLVSCTNVQVKNCYSAGHKGGADTYGFKIESSKSCFFENCIASGCNAIDDGNTIYGFYISGDGDAPSGHYFKNCQSVGNEAFLTCYGFRLDTTHNNYFENCLARANHQTTTGGTSFVAGFGIEDALRNTFINCESSANNGVTGDLTDKLAGFALTAASSQNAFINCTARNNGNTDGSPTTTYGFYVANITSKYCEFRGCKAIANCTDSDGTAYGFFDLATPDGTTNLYIDNFAFGNTNTTSVDNYNIAVPVGTFAELGADIGSLLDLANKPLYYNVGISS
jgi:hypothetical protein